MSQDAHRLSILTIKEIDALYGLPRFTAQERQISCDLSPPERAAVEAHTPAVAVHLTLQLGYFKAKRQFFLYDAEMVSEDLRYVRTLYFPGTSFELLTPLSRPTRLAQQQTILTLFAYRRCDRAAREDLEHKAQRIALLSTQPLYVLREVLHYMACPGWVAHPWVKARDRAVDTAAGHRASARWDQAASVGGAWRL